MAAPAAPPPPKVCLRSPALSVSPLDFPLVSPSASWVHPRPCQSPSIPVHPAFRSWVPSGICVWFCVSRIGVSVSRLDWGLGEHQGCLPTEV